MRPKMWNISTFLVKSHPTGATPLTDFENFRGFYMTNYPTLVFQISRDSLHRLRSYCWETARPSIRPNFSVHPVGKTVRWIQKRTELFRWARRALSPCEVWWRSYNTVCATMWCMFLFVCWSRSESGEHRAFEGCIVRIKIALPFIALSRLGFQPFWEGIALLDGLHISHFRR